MRVSRRSVAGSNRRPISGGSGGAVRPPPEEPPSVRAKRGAAGSIPVSSTKHVAFTRSSSRRAIRVPPARGPALSTAEGLPSVVDSLALTRETRSRGERRLRCLWTSGTLPSVRGVSSLPTGGREEAHAAGAGARGRSQAGGESRFDEPPAGAPQARKRHGGADFERAKATAYSSRTPCRVTSVTSPMRTMTAPLATRTLGALNAPASAPATRLPRGIAPRNASV